MKATSSSWRRAATGAAVFATAVAVALTGVGAGTADALALPDGKKRSSGIDGQIVTLKRTDEHVHVQPSETNNGMTRSARVSGVYTARLNRGGGNIRVGYLVGCQVNVGGLDAGITGGLLATQPIIGGTISFPLAPGQVQAVEALDKDFFKKVVSIQLSGVEVNVTNCAGYAQARSYITVLAAENYSTDRGTVGGDGGAIQSTLYGKPFNLG